MDNAGCRLQKQECHVYKPFFKTLHQPMSKQDDLAGEVADISFALSKFLKTLE